MQGAGQQKGNTDDWGQFEVATDILTASGDIQDESHKFYFLSPCIYVLQTFSFSSSLSLHLLSRLLHSKAHSFEHLLTACCQGGAPQTPCVRHSTFLLPGGGDTLRSEPFSKGKKVIIILSEGPAPPNGLPTSRKVLLQTWSSITRLGLSWWMGAVQLCDAEPFGSPRALPGGNPKGRSWLGGRSPAEITMTFRLRNAFPSGVKRL